MSDSEPEFYMHELEEDLLHIYDTFMRLKVFVDTPDNDLKIKYAKNVYQHHLKLYQNMYHIDAGFDLLAPDTKRLTSSNVHKVDYKIACSAQLVSAGKTTHNTGFYMYPRSSISKSNLRLANHVGIIDAGYRGHLIGMFDVVYADEMTIHKFDRHLQICAPALMPIIVELVHSKDELGAPTTRGEGGFGSTGV